MASAFKPGNKVVHRDAVTVDVGTVVRQVAPSVGSRQMYRVEWSSLFGASTVEPRASLRRYDPEKHGVTGRRLDKT